MSNDVSVHTSYMTGTPDDFWERMKYQKEHKCCWVCNKEDGREIDGKYCSIKCKNVSDLCAKNTRGT